MSSEEEIAGPPAQPGGRSKRVRIVWRKDFLSVKVSELGQHLDRLSNRYIEGLPYERSSTGLVRRGSRPISGLARNAYHDPWYSLQEPVTQAALRPKDSPYDFSLDYA